MGGGGSCRRSWERWAPARSHLSGQGRSPRASLAHFDLISIQHASRRRGASRSAHGAWVSPARRLDAMSSGAGWLRGVVKEVPSGDTIVVSGASKGGIPPEKRITLSGVIAPRLVRPPPARPRRTRLAPALRATRGPIRAAEAAPAPDLGAAHPAPPRPPPPAGPPRRHRRRRAWRLGRARVSPPPRGWPRLRLPRRLRARGSRRPRVRPGLLGRQGERGGGGRARGVGAR
jgi:hypothetical protein